MKRNFVSLFSILLVIALSMAAFAGCGSAPAQQAEQTEGTEPEKQEKGNSQIEEEPDSGEPVTLRFSWWGADVRHEATLAAIEAYQKANPNVTIEAEYQGFEGYQQKMMTQLTGGTAPDLIQIDNVWLMDLCSQKTVLFDDINNYSDIIDLSSFEKQIIDSYCSYDGKLIGIPLGTNGSGLMVNHEFFEKFDIPMDAQFTWDSIIEYGKKVREADPESYLIGIDPSAESIVPLFWEPYLLGETGEYWISDDFQITCTKEEMGKAFSKLKELYDSGAAVPMGETISFSAKMEQLPKWVNGQLGCIMDWSGRLPAIKSALGAEKFATVNVPVVADGKLQTYPTKPSLLVGINNASEHKEEAAKFIEWMVNSEEAAEILKDVRSIPTSKTAREIVDEKGLGDPDVLKMVTNTLANPSSAPPYAGRNAEIVAIVLEEIQKVVYGQQTPEEGAEQLTARVQAKLDSLKK